MVGNQTAPRWLQGQRSLVGCCLWGRQSRKRLKRLSSSSSSKVTQTGIGWTRLGILTSDFKAFPSTFDLTSHYAALGVPVSPIFIWFFSVCRHLGIHEPCQRHIIIGLTYIYHYFGGAIHSCVREISALYTSKSSAWVLSEQPEIHNLQMERLKLRELKGFTSVARESHPEPSRVSFSVSSSGSRLA